MRIYKKLLAERWLLLPLIDWDGETPFFNFDGDEFFISADAFYDHCDENEIEPEAVLLVIGEPQFAREVDAEYWEDELPEDGKLPEEIAHALELFNKAIRNCKTPISLIPGSKRIVMPGVKP